MKVLEIMIKITSVLVFLMFAIFSCGKDDTDSPEYILISGQSNALLCDWSYFESISGYNIINISRDVFNIDELIEDYKNKPEKPVVNKMIFVHGEADSIRGIDGDEYVKKVNEYIDLIGVEEVYFSLVGYLIVNDGQDEMSNKFDQIRDAVLIEIADNESWYLGFSDAMYFNEWGMLVDHIHFSNDGYMLMMESINDAIIINEEAF